jgi:hypothetical protein
MNWKLPRTATALLAVLTLGAAGPQALAPAEGGLWEVSGSARGQDARSICIASPVELAVWEHRGGRCTRVVISDEGNKTTIHYTCASGGFGRSDMTLLTPRSLRVATQGLSDGAPFIYVLNARRVGNCARR